MEFDLVTSLGRGWYELRLRGPAAPPRILVKIADLEGRRRITQLLVVGEALDSATLKAVPIARLESSLNHPRFGLPATDLQIDAAAYDDLKRRGVLFPDELDRLDHVLADVLGKTATVTPASRPRRSRRKPLTRPDGTNPDGFYRRVADAYNDLILTTTAPAPALAEEAGVPVPTVHRWIAEARRRGFLPAARRGRAG